MMPLSGTLCTAESALAIPGKDDAISSETAAVEHNLAIRVIMNDSPRCKCRIARKENHMVHSGGLVSHGCVRPRSLGVLDWSPWVAAPYSRKRSGRNDASVTRTQDRRTVVCGPSLRSRVGHGPDLQLRRARCARPTLQSR